VSEQSREANDALKQQVHGFWNRRSCGTKVTQQPKFSLQYFEEIEDYRYTWEPEILPFAEFSQAQGLLVLEIGVGAGTDFLQWVRSGAKAFGCDFTGEAIENTRRRLDVYGLSCEGLMRADAENLPYADNTFDLVYSWGVLHHTPDTWRAVDEAIRVTRRGGRCKLMLYNKHSPHAIKLWIRHCLIKGQPYRSLSWAIYYHQESIGTKAFTNEEIYRHLQRPDIAGLRLSSSPTAYEEPQPIKPWKTRMACALSMMIARVLRWGGLGWWWLIEFKKVGAN